jgi:APA family basic amino acid/polyamine antiporter
MNGEQPVAGARASVAGGLFRIKPLDAILKDAEKPEYQLRRVLGPVQITLLGIGAIIGAGIFATIGTAAAGDQYRAGAGPALMLSFVVTATVCAFTALCYAEFAAMVPISGSAYTYSYATLGELVAWIIGWDLIIEYAVGNIGVAISWANYFKDLLKSLHVPWLGIPEGIVIPDWLSLDYQTAAKLAEEALKKDPHASTVFSSAPHLFGIPIIFNVPAVAIVAAITIILVWGVRESARFNAVMVCIKIVVLLFFIGVGSMFFKPENWHPFMPNGWAGVGAGAAIVFFAYIGFDAVSTVAEETRDPRRNLPIGIIASLIICTILYIAVSAIFTGLISYPDLKSKLSNEQAEPLTMALKHANPSWTWAVGVVAFGSVIAHTAVLLVYQLGQPRIFFAMARDGLLPPAFARVHPRFRTPAFSTILTGLFVGGIAAFASLDEMVDLTNIGTLFAFILVCAGTTVLRLKDPDRPRPFRVPSGWAWTIALYAGFAAGLWLLDLSNTIRGIILAVGGVVFVVSRNHIFPVLGMLSCAYLIYYLPPTSWLRFAAWLNFGLVIYVGYGSNHSRLTGRSESDRPAEHDSNTAFAGAWLALGGVLLLLVMRGLDLWTGAFRTHESVADFWQRSATALGDVVRRADAWLEVSWFLIVPLALNAFWLCPIVIARALRAERADPGSRRDRNVISIALAALLILLTLAYLAAVVWHNPTFLKWLLRYLEP